VRNALAGFPGVQIVDDRAGNSFPTPLKASGGDDVLVGRIRPDPSQLPRGHSGSPDETPTRGFEMFLCGDQLRKGAALNAVQIAEAMVGNMPAADAGIKFVAGSVVAGRR
jgi:aspartate-semialdehyde dehydrogenase